MSHPARVAAVTSAVIALLYLAVCATVDVVVTRHLGAQVDSRLRSALQSGPEAGAEGRETIGHARDLDDSPVLMWTVDAAGRAQPVASGTPSLPALSLSPGAPVTTTVGGIEMRVEAMRGPAGLLIAGESLAQVRRVRTDLLVAEAAVAPVLVIAIFLGAWVIGRRAAAPIERSRRRQLEFTADASHELRTPLSVIEAEVGLALNAPRSADYYHSALARVAGESKRLRRIVEDLLWLARFDSEPPPPSDRPVALLDAAESCVERFQSVAETRGIEFTLRSDDAGHALVNAPPEWIDRLLGVLVDNACRYSPDGGRVVVTVGRTGARVWMAVEDDGPGIPDAEKDRLFDRFHRATDHPGGAGLGLAIADSVVRETGGRWGIGTSDSGGARMEVSWQRASALEVTRDRAQVRGDLSEKEDAEPGAGQQAGEHDPSADLRTPS